jgi:voltage-gated potassium channel
MHGDFARLFSIAILNYAVRSGRVTSDKIFAAICAYLLIGYAWAFAYAVLDELQPGAFAASTEVPRHDYVGRVLQMRYCSFITLTTVGYGDIVPRTPGARTMVILEAVLGQFYLVALIGRLVGLHIVHGDNSRPDAR